jgi:hypothetical protein
LSFSAVLLVSKRRLFRSQDAFGYHYACVVDCLVKMADALNVKKMKVHVLLTTSFSIYEMIFLDSFMIFLDSFMIFFVEFNLCWTKLLFKPTKSKRELCTCHWNQWVEQMSCCIILVRFLYVAVVFIELRILWVTTQSNKSRFTGSYFVFQLEEGYCYYTRFIYTWVTCACNMAKSAQKCLYMYKRILR